MAEAAAPRDELTGRSRSEGGKRHPQKLNQLRGPKQHQRDHQDGDRCMTMGNNEVRVVDVNVDPHGNPPGVEAPSLSRTASRYGRISVGVGGADFSAAAALTSSSRRIRSR